MSECAATEEYVVARHTHATVYHSTDECCRIQKPDNARSRSKHYVDWHDLDPCEYCHE